MGRDFREEDEDMSDVIVHLQEDLRELQSLLMRFDDRSQEMTEEDRALLKEKSIYLEDTYTLEELQAEGLEDLEIINCLGAVGLFLGYSDRVRGDISEAVDHFMMALHYAPYSKDALSALLDLFMENMEEEDRGKKVYGLLAQMYDLEREQDREMIIECALEAGFVQLCNEITIQETEK